MLRHLLSKSHSLEKAGGSEGTVLPCGVLTGDGSQEGTLGEEGKSFLLQFRDGETEAHLRGKPAPTVTLQGNFVLNSRGQFFLS